MSRLSFSAFVTHMLFHQNEAQNDEIRMLSLASLNDTGSLSIAALFWTQTGWLWAGLTTGWWSVLVFAVIDVALFVARWRMRRGSTPLGGPLEASAFMLFAWINIALVTLVAIDVFVLTQVPSDRASILAIILAIGFSGYVAGLFNAFPVLATLNIILLSTAFGVGLATGYSDTTRPFAVFAPAVAAAFWLLMRRTHTTLLDAIRNQHRNRLLALHDPLTNLPNRALLREKLARMLATIGTEDGSSQIAVLSLDLDCLKSVNDRYGHAAGDWVLVHVANILRERLDNNALACRMGGDEYVILLPQAGRQRVESLAHDIIAAIAMPLDIGSRAPVRVGASIGAAIASDRGQDIDTLLEKADNALYRAKRTGKGRLCLDEPFFTAVPAEAAI